MNQRVNIRKAAKENRAVRRVLFTGKQCQLDLMSLEARQEMGGDACPEVDRIFVVVHGKAEVLVGGKLVSLARHEALFVGAGTTHRLRNVGDEAVKLYAVQARPDARAREVRVPHADP